MCGEGSRPIVEVWFRKLERNNTIINKWFVHMEEKVNNLCDHMGERMQTKFEEV
jgi:hypothetical protein